MLLVAWQHIQLSSNPPVLTSAQVSRLSVLLLFSRLQPPSCIDTDLDSLICAMQHAAAFYSHVMDKKHMCRDMPLPSPIWPGHLMMPGWPALGQGVPAINGTSLQGSKLLKRNLWTSRRTIAVSSSATVAVPQEWWCVAWMARSSTSRYVCLC